MGKFCTIQEGAFYHVLKWSFTLNINEVSFFFRLFFFRL